MKKTTKSSTLKARISRVCLGLLPNHNQTVVKAKRASIKARISRPCLGFTANHNQTLLRA